MWTLRAVESAAKRGALTVGVTNNPGGPLAAAAATLAGLAATLGHARGRLSAEGRRDALDDLERMLPAAIETVLRPPAAQRLAEAADRLASREHLIVVGSGAARAAALVGAAKVHETVRRHATAVNAEEFLHLVGFATGEADGVVVIAPSGTAERERQVAEYAARQEARVVTLVRAGLADEWRDGQVVPLPTDGLAPWSGALVAMTALHTLAESFSRLAGTNPDRPEGVGLEYVLGLLYTAPLEGW